MSSRAVTVQFVCFLGLFSLACCSPLSDFLYCACLPPMLDLSCSSDGKESVCSAGDPGSIPGSERSSGEGDGNPLQYSWLENPMDRGPWRTTVHVVTKSQTRLSDHYSTKERSWKIVPLWLCLFIFILLFSGQGCQQNRRYKVSFFKNWIKIWYMQNISVETIKLKKTSFSNGSLQTKRNEYLNV